MRHEKGLIEAMWNVSLEKMYIVPHLVYKWDKLHFSRAVTADVCQTFYAVNVIKGTWALWNILETGSF